MKIASFTIVLLASQLDHGTTAHVRTHPKAWNALDNTRPHPIHTPNTTTRQFTCETLTPGLTLPDCLYMSAIGMFSQGLNPLTPLTPTANSSLTRNTTTSNSTNLISLSPSGPNLFTFINASPSPVILILWHAPPTDPQSSFMNVRQPQVSYSLPEHGSAVDISVANGVPGGWAALYIGRTKLTEYGQVGNTFGEFNSGDWATADVSRLVDMHGDGMLIRVFGKGVERDREGEPLCVSDLSRCVYVCSEEGVESCGEAGTYELVNCEGPYREKSIGPDGNPTGGCQGWSFGGRLEVIFE